MRPILTEITDVFSIFHDGVISGYIGDENLLRIEIGCEYLAERVNPSYKYFHVELEGIEKLEFLPWMNPIELPQISMKEAKDIFQAPLEILSAEIENDYVKIYCNQHNSGFGYSGGTILVNCTSVKVFDQGSVQITIDNLARVCNDYWDDFSKRIEQSIKNK